MMATPRTFAAGRIQRRPVEAAAPAVADHQGHRVEDVDGRADVLGAVNGIEHPHQTGEDVAAIYPVRPQSKPCGQKDITAQRDGHTGEEAQADPPEVAALAVPQQIEQGKGDPREPCKIGDDGVLAKGDDIVQLAVYPDGRDGDIHLEPVERGQIKYSVKSHERDGMACKPAAHQ